MPASATISLHIQQVLLFLLVGQGSHKSQQALAAPGTGQAAIELTPIRLARVARGKQRVKPSTSRGQNTKDRL